VLLGDPGPDVPAGEAAAGWAGYVVCGDGCGVQAEIARRDIPNMHNRFIWSSLGKCANDCPDRFMRCWRGSVAGRETKPPVSSPTMQKLEKFHGPVRGTPGVRWRVVDGASPNVARYVPAKRPSCVNPKRWATSATLALSGWASRSARRTSFNRRSSTYWVGLMPRNSAQHDRRVRSLTTIRSHGSRRCRGRLRCSAKTSSNLTMILA